MRGEGCCVQNARKTHCKRGHEFTPDNIYWRKTGGRQCKACANLRSRREAAA